MPKPISADEVRQLNCYHRQAVPIEYLDELGHLTFPRYFDIFSKAWWPFNRAIGLDKEFAERERGGLFALEHHIQFFAEVNAGSTVAIHTRLVGVGRKRVHYISFMLDETHDRLAAMSEGISIFANLDTRRSAELPAAIAANLSDMLAQDAALPWPPPLCGIIGVDRRR